MTQPTAGPLAGITVLDLSTVGPAARCTRLLADYGASVVKVGPVPGRGPAPTMPQFFAYGAGRAFKRVQIDLRSDEGRAVFLILAAAADVVVESFRPGVVDRLGIGYNAVRSANEDVVYVSTTGYGQSGPRSGWAGHDLDYLAVGGYLAMSGTSDELGCPALPGATIADAAAGGMQAALAVCAALVRRATDGGGTYLDVAVADGVLWLMSLAAEEQLALGKAVRRGHDVLSGRYACYATYPTRDGKYLAVAAIETKFFANLCRLLECDNVAELQYVDEEQARLRALLTDLFLTRDRDEWISLLAAADTCVAPVLDVEEVVADGHFVGRGAVVEARHPTQGNFLQLGAVLAGMAALPAPVQVADQSVTDTAEVLAAAGLPKQEVEALLGAGVVA